MLKKISDWLSEKVSDEITINIILAFSLICLIYGEFADSLVRNYFFSNDYSCNVSHSIITWMTPISIVVDAFIEEVMTRLPLVLIVLIFTKWQNARWKPIATIVSVLILSAIFGYLHGGVANIFVRGPIGIFLSILFLKTGGYNGKVVRPLLASTTMHTLINVCALLSCLMRGMEYI